MNPPRHFKRVLCVLLAVLLVAGVSGSYWLSRPAPGAALEAPTPRRGVVCFGHVDLEHGVTSLYPLQPGRVADVLVRENEPVATGAVLLRLEDQQARLRVREAEAAVEAAREQLAEVKKLPQQHRARIAQQESAVEAMRQRLSAARHLLERKQEMDRLQVINKKEVAIAQDQVKEAEAGERAELEKLNELKLRDPQAEVRRAEKETAMLEARLEQAQQALEECNLKAPRAGKVIRILVGPGDVLSGQPQQPALVLCPDEPRLVRAEVEQEFAGRVALDQPVVVEDDSAAGPTWKGKVIRIADGYQQRRPILHDPARYTDVRTLEFLVALDAGQPPLRLGQRVRVVAGASGR